MCRIYNKTLQLRKRGETWPTAIWEGMDLEHPVWRIEFQFRREALKDFQVDGAHLHSVATVLAMRQALWEYGTEWLSLRVPTADSNSSRWPCAPVWEQLRDVRIGSPCAELVRKRVRDAEEQRLLAGFCGYASSLAARGYGTKLSETLLRVQPAAEGYMRKKGRTFEKVTTHKRERVLDTMRQIGDRMPWRARRAS